MNDRNLILKHVPMTCLPNETDISEELRIEIVFHAVEYQLLMEWHNRHRGTTSVPEFFAHIEADDIHEIVTDWWHFYQEFSSAAVGRNRTAWVRSEAHNVPLLTRLELANALKEIHSLIPPEPIQAFRPLTSRETIGLNLLVWTALFYSDCIRGPVEQ